MEKITKVFDVYEFDELEDNIKEKLIEKESENQYESYCDFGLQDDMEWQATELLEKCFGKNAKFKGVYYSLSYCQGDGVMIEFDIDLDDINKKYKKLTKNAMDKINKIGYTDINVRQDGRYYHERSFSINWECYHIYIDNFDKQQEKLENMLMKDFHNDIVNMNIELTNFGYKMLEGTRNDTEYIKDTLRENKYLYDGEVFYE